MTIRVAVVDDQALVREAFSMILDAQPDIEVVGDADNGRSGVELCRPTRLDVVLMDVRMPILDGIELLAHGLSNGEIAERMFIGAGVSPFRPMPCPDDLRPLFALEIPT